jgi:hypothetical protein
MDLIDLIVVLALAAYTGLLIPRYVRGRTLSLAGVLFVSAPTFVLVMLLVFRPR